MSDTDGIAVATEATELCALRAEVARLNKMVCALMDRAERTANLHASEFGLLQTTVLLESQVRARTQDLERALRENEKITRDLHVANEKIMRSEKLASMGQLAAGVAHEINNPIAFVGANLATLQRYTKAVGDVLEAYAAVEAELPAGSEALIRLEKAKEAADLEYIRQDTECLVAESIEGTERVRKIVQDLRNFSRSDSTEHAPADLHAALECTLNVVWNEIKYKAEVVREFGELPPVECVVGQINQVFLNLLVNAAHAIPERGIITLRSGVEEGGAWISVSDTGCGIPPDQMARIFEPFFTTKPVGKGTGLGLAVSYGIIERHGGRLDVVSTVGEGTTFTIRLPLRQG